MSMVTKIKEYLIYENKFSKFSIAWIAIVCAEMLVFMRKYDKAFSIMGAIHRANLSDSASIYISNVIRKALNSVGKSVSVKGIREVIENYPENWIVPDNLSRYIESPTSLLRGNILVLKSSSENEKGVIYLYYSYIYPLFLRLFDVNEIEKKYYIVIEPSWTGYCDINILCMTRLKNPVVVGSIEPYDSKFVNDLDKNLIAAEFSGNTWIDPRKFFPIPGAVKKYDLIYIASWGSYKRHWALFKALQKLKSEGYSLRVALVGYAIDLTKNDIERLARESDIFSSISIFENVNQETINELLNESKVNLLWSRREGVNRAIIEGMAADIPCIIRKGFNYGHNYHYVNNKTGIFSDDRDLCKNILKMLENTEKYSPRAYIKDRMTPEFSTSVINNVLKNIAERNGEQWSRGIVIRDSNLNGLTYRDASNWDRFEPDYLYLEQHIKDAV